MTTSPKPSPVEYALQAIANYLDPVELYEILEGLCLDGEIELEHLSAFHTTYPSLLSKESYQALLHHFEE